MTPQCPELKCSPLLVLIARGSVRRRKVYRAVRVGGRTSSYPEDEPFMHQSLFVSLGKREEHAAFQSVPRERRPQKHAQAKTRDFSFGPKKFPSMPEPRVVPWLVLSMLSRTGSRISLWRPVLLHWGCCNYILVRRTRTTDANPLKAWAHG